MESVQEIALTVLMIVGVMLAVVVAFVLAAISVSVQQRVEKWANAVDANPVVVGFGRTPIGQAANQYLSNFLPQVDEASDPLVQTITNLKATQYLVKAGLMSPDLAASVLKSAVETGIRLTDGIPNVVVSVEKQQ